MSNTRIGSRLLPNDKGHGYHGGLPQVYGLQTSSFGWWDKDGRERATHVQAFNAKDSEIQVFILSTRAGGKGLNLQTADTVIM